MSTPPIYLTEADVGRLVTVKDAIATLEALFATWGQPSTSDLPRQRARLAGGAFNLMGAAYGAKGVHGLKAYAGVKGAQFHTLLYSSLDGKLKAMIEADLLGQMRTGAASGVATKLLANADAHTLAVIGTGKQSRAQIAAVCAVRPITRVKVFSRTAEHREAYARSVEKDLGVEVLPASSAQACVAEADVVVTITKSAEPVCRAQWLAEGAHVNVAGANSNDRREVDAGTVLRAAVKATDHIEQAKVEAGEFRELVAAGKLAWSAIRELGEFVTGKAAICSCRRTPASSARERHRYGNSWHRFKPQPRPSANSDCGAHRSGSASRRSSRDARRFAKDRCLLPAATLLDYASDSAASRPRRGRPLRPPLATLSTARA